MKKVSIFLTSLTIICILLCAFSVFQNFASVYNNFFLLSESYADGSITSGSIDGNYVVKVTREALYKSIVLGIANILKDLITMMLVITHNIIVIKLYNNLIMQKNKLNTESDE